MSIHQQLEDGQLDGSEFRKYNHILVDTTTDTIVYGHNDYQAVMDHRTTLVKDNNYLRYEVITLNDIKEAQTTRERKCIRCDKPISMMQQRGFTANPDYAMEGTMRGYFGSRHDTHAFLAWICDDCAAKVSPMMMVVEGPDTGKVFKRQ